METELVTLSEKLIHRRYRDANIPEKFKKQLLQQEDINNAKLFKKNIERYIGTIKIPIGICGPLKVNGQSANGEYFIPLATSEGALVASYSRGSKVITEAGGADAIVLAEAITRCPIFRFRNLKIALAFSSWVALEKPNLKELAESTTAHGKLLDIEIIHVGCDVFLEFVFHPGNASGQNMVTIATQKAFDYICLNMPSRADLVMVESNFSSDKKPSYGSFMGNRGRSVIATVNIHSQISKRLLGLSAKELFSYFEGPMVAAMASGQIGFQCHYANAIAAVFLATGQDIACVAESAMGITSVRLLDDEIFQISVTLKNLIISTVGGGTSLPSTKACLEILKLPQDESQTRALAEIIASLCIAGELSLTAAVGTNSFTSAHLNHGRSVKSNSGDN